MKPKILHVMLTTLICASASAQVNSGSNGSDGALDLSAYFNSGTNIVINMADHPNGIYQYTYVKIPSGVTVTFIPNANNTPVTWLVQNGVTIDGTVSISGQTANNEQGALGGPGGYRGGNGANGNSPPTAGQGPGGGAVGGSGSYNYGNTFLIPLLGGSGGGGLPSGPGGGGGGGGAILIAASSTISLNGIILAIGGNGDWVQFQGQAGGGSGGAIRLVASQISGSGYVYAYGSNNGHVRFDTYDNEFSGGISGTFSFGFQPVIIPSAGQIPQLTVTSVGGVPVSTPPTGALSTPDAILSAQQNNPVPVVVSCANLPLNTPITVSVKPANGSAVSATGINNTGTSSSSTATISIVIPRGGGLIYATAATTN